MIFVLLPFSDLPTVRQFIRKQTRLKSIVFGELEITEDVIDTEEYLIDTIKVLKCCS